MWQPLVSDVDGSSQLTKEDFITDARYYDHVVNRLYLFVRASRQCGDTSNCCVLPRETLEHSCSTAQLSQSLSCPQRKHFQGYRSSQNSTNSSIWRSGKLKWRRRACLANDR